MRRLVVLATGACVAAWLAFWLPEAIRDVRHFFEAVTTTVDFEKSAWMLLGECGYDLNEFEQRKEPAEGCVSFLRKRIHLASTRHNFWSVPRKGYGKLCVKDLLDLEDDELVRTYADWASRERAMLFAWSADVLVNVHLYKGYRCSRRLQGQV